MDGQQELVEDVSLGRAQARKLLSQARRAQDIKAKPKNIVPTRRSPRPKQQQDAVTSGKTSASPTCNHSAVQHPELPRVVRVA